MDLVALTEEIFRSLVHDPDSVTVKEFPTDDERTMEIQVLVPESEIARVIGKNGRCANAVRTLVQASSYLKDNKRVKINIDSF